MKGKFACNFALAAIFQATSFMTSAWAASQKYWSGNSAGYRITWTAENLLAQGGTPPRVVFDAAEYAKGHWAKVADRPDSTEYSTESDFTMLSLVGPILSVKDGEDCDCGGAHPSEVNKFVAIDLQKSAPGKLVTAKLTDYFPPAAIYDALMKDPVVKAILSPAEGDESYGVEFHPASFEELNKILEDLHTYKKDDCAYWFGPGYLERFVFYDYRGGHVSVRLSLTHASESCRGNYIQVGVLLPVSDGAMKRALESAQHGEDGVLMEKLRTVVSEKAVTTFSFPEDSPK